MTTLTLVNTCPDWCTMPAGHDLPEEVPGDSRLHRGPSFGPFRVASVEGPGEDGSPYVCIADPDVPHVTDLLGPAELASLRAHALAAAGWLEGHA